MSEKAQQYSDEEIIQKVLAGELGLFEILIRRYNALLYKTGRSYYFGHEDTQDLMQDTFIDVYKNLARFEQRSSFKTWITRIMLNNCYRKKQKGSFKNEMVREINESDAPEFSDEGFGDTAKHIMNKEMGRVVEHALLKIPLDYRLVFSLREVNGLSVEETADALSISGSNVKVRLNRAKNMLRKEVEKSYVAEDIFEFNLVYCDAMVANVMSKIQAMGSGV